VRVEPGDELTVPSLSMSASVTYVVMNGGFPVFADVESDSLCVDPEVVEAPTISRPRAIVVVHLFGRPAAMDRLMTIAT